MGILRGHGGGLDAFRHFMFNRGRQLYDEIKEIDVYRNHRDSLRPWDRSLPLPVQAEANRRSQWTLNPPSTTEVFSVLIFCIGLLLCVGLIPMYSNFTTMAYLWRDIVKPDIVYTNNDVLLAIWIIVHISTAMSLWFVYLTEGWYKHQLVLLPFAVTILLDCMWVDILWYTFRFDYALGLWGTYCLLTMVTMALMIRDDIGIGALFLTPQFILSCMIIVYLVEFMKIHGAEFENAKIQRPYW